MNMRQLQIKSLWAERLGIVLLVAAVVWSVITGIDYATLDKRHPISEEIPIRATALNDPILEGDMLSVRVTRHKVRSDCETLSVRRAVSVTTGAEFGLGDALWKGASADQTHVTFEYATQYLWPDDYTLVVDLTYICPGDLQFNLHQPDVEFTVLPLDYVPPEVEQKMLIDELVGEVENLQRQLNELPVPEMTE